MLVKDQNTIEKNFFKKCTRLLNVINEGHTISVDDLYSFREFVIFSLRNDIFFEGEPFEQLTMRIRSYWHYELTLDTDLHRYCSYIQLYQMVILLLQGIKNKANEQYVSSLADSHVQDIELINTIKKSPGITFKELRDIFSISPDVLSKRLSVLKEQRFVVSRREGEWQYYLLTKLGDILYEKLFFTLND